MFALLQGGMQGIVLPCLLLGWIEALDGADAPGAPALRTECEGSIEDTCCISHEGHLYTGEQW